MGVAPVSAVSARIVALESYGAGDRARQGSRVKGARGEVSDTGGTPSGREADGPVSRRASGGSPPCNDRSQGDTDHSQEGTTIHSTGTTLRTRREDR